MPKPKAPGHAGNVEAVDKKDLQRKYLQFQMARQYLSAMTEQKNELDAKLTEMAMTIASLESLQKTKSGEEIMSTLGSDVYVQSNVADARTAIIGVGAGVYMKKPLAGAISTLKARLDEFSKAGAEMAAQIGALSEQLTKMEPELQALAAQAQ